MDLLTETQPTDLLLTPIVFKFKGAEYPLECTIASLAWLAQQGVDMAQFSTHKMPLVMAAFAVQPVHEKGVFTMPQEGELLIDMLFREPGKAMQTMVELYKRVADRDLKRDEGPKGNPPTAKQAQVN